MRTRWIGILLVGWSVASATVLAAGEPEIVWPQEWTAFGPVLPVRTQNPYGTPKKEHLPPGDTLKAIPRELRIRDRSFSGRKLRMEDGRLDPGKLMGATERGYGVYLFAPLTVASQTTVQIGAGADWWMQWWVDGQPVYDTLVNGESGNWSSPITPRDHVFEITLAKGEHVLAVAVFSGMRGAKLAVASPQEMRANPVKFRDVMHSGIRKYKRGHWSNPVSYAAARADFQRALKLAATDAEKAEAQLAVADNELMDIAEANWPAMQQHYAAVLALTGATPDQRAKATLGVGETWLRQKRGDLARQEFAKAAKLSSQTNWAATVQLAVARSHLQEKNDAAARSELTQLLARPGLDPYLEFSARSHLEALNLAQRIRPDHPRLFFNAHTWPAVKTRLTGVGNATAFKQLTQRAAKLPNDYAVQDWGLQVMEAALTYRATGDAVLLAKIRRMLRASVDFYVARTAFNSHYESRLGCMAALDWVWNDLPPAEREGLRRDLLRYVFSKHTDDLLCGGSERRADGRPSYVNWSYYYEPMIMWYAGAVLLDRNADAVDYSRTMAVLGRGYYNIVLDGLTTYMDVTRDGSAPMTELDYALGDFPNPVWSFLHCWQSAVGGQVPTEWAYVGLSPEYALRNTLGVKPGRVRDFGFSRSWRGQGGFEAYGNDLYDHLGQFIHFFGKTRVQEAAIAGHLREHMAKAGCTGSGAFAIYPWLLNLESAPAPRLPDDLPLARYFPGNGLAFMSSGFESNSTYALFCIGCTGITGHKSDPSEHFDTGHFTIFKNGCLALDSGTRALAGGLGPHTDYDSATVAHNAVLIHMPGEVMGPDTHSNSGGQRKRPEAARPLAFESDRLFAYAATDATATYHTDKCAQMVRQFVFLPPDHFVVFDRVISKKADFAKTWLLHTANEPAIAGREFRADQAGGRILCRTLYPTDAVLEKIGGPGKEFWADGRNWNIPAASTHLTSLGISSPEDIQENMGRWRVEVKPGRARTEDCFLHLIQVGDRKLQAISPGTFEDSPTSLRVAVKIGDRTCALTFKKSGEVGGHIQMTRGSEKLLDRALISRVARQTHASERRDGQE